MCDETLHEAIDQLILQRINDQGSRSNPALQEACSQFEDVWGKLEESLTPEQKGLFMACEDALALVDGETMNCFYRAGFFDAVTFLLGWRNGDWN